MHYLEFWTAVYHIDCAIIAESIEPSLVMHTFLRPIYWLRRRALVKVNERLAAHAIAYVGGL